VETRPFSPPLLGPGNEASDSDTEKQRYTVLGGRKREREGERERERDWNSA